MLIIGCDYRPSFQQIQFVDTETSDCGERRLKHKEEAEQFYRDLRALGLKVRIGLEASGYTRWFERHISRNKGTRCCVFCWWPPRKRRCAVIPSGGDGICT